MMASSDSARSMMAVRVATPWSPSISKLSFADYRAANGRAQEARSTVVCLTTARPENRPLRRVVPTYASRAGAWPSVTAPTAATRRQRPMDRYPMHWYPYLSIGMDGVMEWTASWNGLVDRMDWRPLRNNGYQTTTQRGGNGRGRRQAVPGRSLQCQQRQIVKDGEKMSLSSDSVRLNGKGICQSERLTAGSGDRRAPRLTGRLVGWVSERAYLRTVLRCTPS